MSESERRIAPEDIESWRLPDPFVNGEGQPLTVEEAKETYLRIVQSNRNSDQYTSRYEKARQYHYPRILDADRFFQDNFEGLTTCLLTRSTYPSHEPGNQPTPWEINEMLNGAGIRRSVREAIDYHLDDFEFEWVGVTTARVQDGTLYELIYLWINDPSNEVEVSHFEPALERHIERCPISDPENQRSQGDEIDRPIVIRHDPSTVEQEPEQFVSIFGSSEHTPFPPTAGALHVATKLPDLVVGDFYDNDRPDPSSTLVRGAATGFAVDQPWVRYSSGIPDLNDS